MKRREGRQKCCLLFMLFFLYVSYFLHPSMLSPVRVWRRVYARKHTHTEIQMAPVIESISYSISSFSILNLWCGKRWKWIGLVGTTSQHSHLISYIYMWTTYPFVARERRSLYLSIYALVPFAVAAPVSTLVHTHTHMSSHAWRLFACASLIREPSVFSAPGTSRIISYGARAHLFCHPTQQCRNSIRHWIWYTISAVYTHTLSTPICNNVCVCSVRERLTVWIGTQQQQQQAQNRKKSREIMYIIFIYAYTKSCTEPPRGIFYIFEI